MRTDAPASFFSLIAPDGTEVFPIKPDGTEGCWRWSKSTYEQKLRDGFVEWVDTNSGWQVYAKQFLDENATKPPETLWLHNEVNHNHGAAEELKKLLKAKVFDSPKPKELISKMLKIATNYNSIVLDFFSGSATTAHAVMQLNSEDGGNRKFIMVQLPEKCDEKSEAYKAGYKNVSEIGKERIRRAGEKIKEDNKDKENIDKLDTGFRVLKVDSTNMKDVYYAANEYNQDMLAKLDSNIKEDRTDMDLLYGVLIDWGLPLSLNHRIEKIENITVHFYDCPVDDGELLTYNCSLAACFEEKVPENVVREIAKRQPLRAVFRDSSFVDSPGKINVEEIFKLLAPNTSVRVI